MEMQALAEENKALKTDKTLEFKKLEVDVYNAETQRIRALSDHEVDANEMEMGAIQQIIDGSKTLDEHDIRRDENERKHELGIEQLKVKQSTPAVKSTSSSGTKSQPRKANG